MKTTFLAAGITSLALFCATIPPGMAQIVNNPSDDSTLSTWSLTPGAGDAWVESLPANSLKGGGLSYNVWRAVPTNASLGRTIKFGDLTNTYLPNGSQYFQDRNKSISDLLAAQGKSTQTTTIQDSSYASSLTLGEIIEANNGQLPVGIQNQIRNKTTQGTSSKGSNGLNTGSLRSFGTAGGALIKKYADLPDELKEVPIGELASGDFQGALDVGIQRGAKEAVENLPAAWKNLPVGSIASALAAGDYKAALNQGLQFGAQKLVEHILSDEELKELPIGAIAEDLPISDLGNIANAPLSSLPRVGSQYISKIPGLKDAPIVQSAVSAAIPLLKGDIAVKLDIAYAGKKEQPDPNAFTGGTPKNVFTPTNCKINSTKKGRGKTHNCAHFQMGYMNAGINKGRYKGKQMVDGQVQQVKGGKGMLAKVNGGWEPTGWKPWGDLNGYNPAKLSLKNIKEYPGKGKPANAAIQLDLQIVVEFPLTGKKTMTPHFIPVPTSFKATQNQDLLLFASGGPPKQIQDAINALANRSDTCDYVAQTGAAVNTKYGYKAQPEVDQADLKAVPTGDVASGRAETLHKDAATAFNKMQSDAAKQGIDLYTISGFRSVADQQALWDAQVQKQGSAAAAAKISAPPGYSEHHTGYALDVGTSQSTDLSKSFDQTAAYKWLSNNGANYGFQQSYTGQSGQGAGYEPWHFRYIGSAASKQLFDPQVQNIPTTSLSTAQLNLKIYLAIIGAGESGNGTNLGSLPSPGSDAPYGEYQFRGSTRQAVLAQYPGLDAWSPDKATRDKAALAWIGMYGNEINVDILGAIQKGDFDTANKALGKNQFTSLPGGSEASPLWSNPKNLAKYGAGGTGQSGSAVNSNCVAATSGAGSSSGAYTGKTSGALIDPTLGKGPMTSDFGPRSSPCSGCSSNHMGLDFGVPDGTAVAAAANGKIVFQGWISGYGNTVFVDHGNGTMTQYSHLQGFVSNVGANVPQGAVIALSGHSGVGTGAHLHFGVLQGTSNGNIHSGSYVDPRGFLK